MFLTTVTPHTMGQQTAIQWTDASWNIAVGCTKVDEDCKFCYMYRDSLKGTRFDPKVIRQTAKGTFNMPLKLKQPSRIFTCSYTDFFHEAIDGYRHEAWDIIRRCPRHTFQILTKRPERILAHLPADWGDGWGNVWLGTSIGSHAAIERGIRLMNDLIDHINVTTFLSLEPLHGYVNISELPYMPDWVIVGGESGNDTGAYRYRPCALEWIERIIATCAEEEIPLFVKQLGTHLAKQMGLKDRHGGDITEWPKHLQIRQFPTN